MTSTVVVPPRVGTAAFFGVLVAAQLVTSVVADRFGWFAFQQRDNAASRGRDCAADLGRIARPALLVHEPSGYECPFCRLLRGVETERNRLADVIWRDERTTAFVSPKWWPANPGAAIVIPNEHVENLYGMSDVLLGAVYGTARRVAEAMKAVYGCDGTSMRQHNEPGGQQDVWHFHVHVFPRWVGDELYARQAEARWVSAEERAPYAKSLRAALDLPR